MRASLRQLWESCQWHAILLTHLVAALAADGDEYVKVINGRCIEREGALPLGAPGSNWSTDFDEEARAWCDVQHWCVGYMRYLGEDQQHCYAWCGRPQFCQNVSLLPDEQWASYIRASALAQGSQEEHADDEGEGVSSEIGLLRVDCPWPYEGSLLLWSKGLPQEQDASHLRSGGEEICHVLHHKRGQTLPWLHGEDNDLPPFQGVLSENEDTVHFFTADTRAEPWLYSIDSNEYIGGSVEEGAQAFGPKLHYLSLFFLTPDSACDGKRLHEWGPEEAEEVMPGHIYVDDGSKDTRRNAFRPYHFTVICGNVDEANYVPQALVDALGFASHPLVPKRLHDALHRAFFHLPDAVQAYTRIHPLMIEDYLEKMYNDPTKNDAMYYKQSFLFLLQELFRYRYRQPFPQRLGFAACGLCDERRRLRRIADVGAAGEARGDPLAVGMVVCVMSRRSGHVLRAAIRETWATQVAGVAALRFFVGAATGSIGEQPAVVADAGAGDVVELAAPEAYKAVTLKAFAMLDWAYAAFPNLRFLVRADDDVYLRTGPLFAQLERRPPITYLWGNFDHGSSPVRDPSHPHYNSYEQFPKREHPLFGDLFPPYARGHLWAMSSDLLAMVVDVWRRSLEEHSNLSLALARSLPHPDDPALGVAISNLVDSEHLSINVDDRDLNHFALNPSCNATYLNIHNRTWVVHHVSADAMRCMWAVDSMAEDGIEALGGAGGVLPDLCPCSMDVTEEVNESPDEEPFDYPRGRFHE